MADPKFRYLQIVALGRRSEDSDLDGYLTIDDTGDLTGFGADNSGRRVAHCYFAKLDGVADGEARSPVYRCNNGMLYTRDVSDRTNGDIEPDLVGGILVPIGYSWDAPIYPGMVAIFAPGNRTGRRMPYRGFAKSRNLDGFLGYGYARGFATREALEELTSTVGGTTLYVALNRVYGASVWEVKMTNADLSMTAQDLAVHSGGAGRAWDQATFYTVAGVGDTEQNNPTASGDPYGSFFTPSVTGFAEHIKSHEWCHGSHVLSLDRGNDGEGDYIESATVPLEFVPDENNNQNGYPFTDGGPANPVIYPEMMLSRRVTLHWRGQEGIMHFRIGLDHGQQVDFKAGIQGFLGILTAHMTVIHDTMYAWNLDRDASPTLMTGVQVSGAPGGIVWHDRVLANGGLSQARNLRSDGFVDYRDGAGDAQSFAGNGLISGAMKAAVILRATQTESYSFGTDAAFAFYVKDFSGQDPKHGAYRDINWGDSVTGSLTQNADGDDLKVFSLNTGFSNFFPAGNLEYDLWVVVGSYTEVVSRLAWLRDNA